MITAKELGPLIHHEIHRQLKESPEWNKYGMFGVDPIELAEFVIRTIAADTASRALLGLGPKEDTVQIMRPPMFGGAAGGIPKPRRWVP